MTAVVIGVGCAYGIMGRGELIEYVAVGNGINSKSCEYHWMFVFIHSLYLVKLVLRMMVINRWLKQT